MTLAAFAWGGWRERLISAVMFVRWYLGAAIFLWPTWGPFRPPSDTWRVPITGGVFLAACLFSAARGRSYWVIWASAFAVLGLITDTLGVFDLGISHWASRSAARIWLYLLGAMILWGAWTSHAERRSGARLSFEGRRRRLAAKDAGRMR